jgi:acetyl esterase/lipase
MNKRFNVFMLLLILSVRVSCQYNILTNIVYTDLAVSEKQKLDIYIPDDEQLMPCLVWIHGGAWLAGSKEGLPEEVDTLLYYGYVVASINYRLSSDALFPAQIQDCKAAIRFLKENCAKYKIDSSRIAVAGSSAGGHLAALVGTSYGIPSLEDTHAISGTASARVQAVVDFYGPTDFLIMDELPDECKEPMIHLDPRSPESLLLGCNVVDCPEKVTIANPITYITEDDPPFLIIHGTSDCTVTPKSSLLLEQRLRGEGIRVKLYMIPGAGHGGKEFIAPEVKVLVLDFLDTILK